MKGRFILLLLLAPWLAHSQLIVNEVSNGSAGTQEFMELVVVGTPGTTQDIRGWIFDDNGGNYGCDIGKGIASGHLRFADTAVWRCVPSGSIILIYNQDDKNPALTLPDDFEDSNSDRIYILPINAPGYFMENTAAPSFSNCGDYSNAGNMNTASTAWDAIGLANAGDLYQTLKPDATPYQAIGYGNIGPPVTPVYFSGSGAAMTFQFVNIISDDFFDQSNWTARDAATFQSPGAANSPENQAWLESFSLKISASDTVICPGDSITFSDNTIGGINSWMWDFTDGTSLTAGQTVTHQFDSSGLFNVELTINTGNNCEFKSYKTITVNNSIPLQITGSGFLCPDDSVLLSSSLASGNQWFLNGNPVSTMQSFFAKDTGIYSLTNTSGCATAAPPFAVASAALPVITASSSSYRICEAKLLDFSAASSSGNISGWSWNFNDGTPPVDSQNAAHAFVTNGIYAVELAAVTVDNCIVRDTLNVLVEINSSPSITGQDTLCQGDKVVLTSNYTGGNEWYFNNNALNIFSDSLEVNEAGIYTVSNPYTCDTLSNSFTVAVLDTATLVYSIEPDTIFTKDTVLLSYLGNCDSITWLFGDSLSSASNGIKTSFVYPFPGEYEITLTASSDSFCPRALKFKITVLQSDNLFIPNVFTPNDDSFNDELTFDLENRELKSLEIFNRWGEKMFEGKGQNHFWDGTYKGKDATAGIYYYVLSTVDPNKRTDVFTGFIHLVR